ncbi:MAG TPA: site-specific tyrosine recombinase/integron integrase [Methanomicrobiales archaeon]|nr:site-specific tyrosine recombinase/integron integrase [Methanomicrobiales archaeon]
MEKGHFFSREIPKYQYYLHMRNYSERTQKSYVEILNRFARYVWLRRHRPDRITYQWKDLATARIDTEVEVPNAWITDFLSFLASLRKYHPHTLHRIISTLSSFYKFLKLQKVVEANPVADMDRPKVKGQELVYMKHSQVLELLGKIPDLRDRLVVRTIYSTGVRVSELSGILVGDIDFDAHTIRVMGKGGKIRIVFMDGETLEEIRAFIGDRKEGPLFPGQMGKAISPRTVQFIFRKYAPPGITPHKLRHSYASELYSRSKNLKVVQENLGHSSIKTTEIYLHTDVEERKKVYEKYFPFSTENEKDTGGHNES